MPLISPVPVHLDPGDVVRTLRLDRRPGGKSAAGPLLAEAASLFRPRAFYREAFIESRSTEGLTIGGRFFRSRLLRGQAGRALKVFAFVLTIGSELEEAAVRAKDLLHRYDLETLADMAVEAAAAALRERLGRTSGLGRLAVLSPGTVEDWPVTEQVPLFALLGDGPRRAGVRLTDSMMMIPRKSVSGLLFPSKETFLSCRLCSRRSCPSRKAPPDPDFRRRLSDREA